jgi:di/tricarboxylate transporter
MLPVTVLSAFMNNTPVVAMMIPVIVGFSNVNSLKPSKLLIPLSYSSIFGGTCTLMGTSTNLVVFGLAKARDPDFDMSLFEIGIVGLPVALAGLVFIVLFGPRYLPDRESHFVEAVQGITEYVVTLVVRDPETMPGGNPLVGATVAEIDLCNVPGVSLVKIERKVSSHLGASTIPHPNPDRVLRAGDQLFFAGNVHRMLDVTKEIDAGLEFVFGPANTLQGTDYTLLEVTVGKQSKLAGKTLRQLKFRQAYNASVLAVYRHSDVKRKHDLQPVGTFEIRRGDGMLLLATPDFKVTFGSKNVTDFASITELTGTPPKSRKAMIATAMCVGMICASVAGVHLLTAAFVTTVLLINAKCLTTNDVYGALNLPVLVVIAAAFGISHAMVNSGSAALIARGLVAASAPSGLVGLQVVIYVVTVIFSAMVTNNAAVTIMFPIAYNGKNKTSLDLICLLPTLSLDGRNARACQQCVRFGVRTQRSLAGRLTQPTTVYQRCVEWDTTPQLPRLSVPIFVRLCTF